MVCVPLDKVSSMPSLKLALHVLEGVQKGETEERERGIESSRSRTMICGVMAPSGGTSLSVFSSYPT